MHLERDLKYIPSAQGKENQGRENQSSLITKEM